MHTMQIIYQIADLYQVRLMVELIFFCFHGVSRITPLTPSQWVGPTHYRGPHPLLGRGGNAENVGPT